MIWILLSNIPHETKFTGIVRTEYELSLYAHQLFQKGEDVGYCTFHAQKGFIKISYSEIESILENLNDKVDLSGKKISQNKDLTSTNLILLPRRNLTFFQKILRSYYKRLNTINFFIEKYLLKKRDKEKNKNEPCFRDGDTIISVGQRTGTNEFNELYQIKKNINLEFKLLCHDLMPISYPNFVNKQSTQLFSRYINEAILVVDYFFCNSKFTKQELQNFYYKSNLPPPPMKVLTLGSDLHTKKEQIFNLSQNIRDLIAEPYLIFVSTIEIRKNHQLIYDMYIKLLSQGIKNLPKIYFVGRRGWRVDSLLKSLDKDARIQDKIIILDNISDKDLITLYVNCWFTLYPSFIEGYGLPVAESLSFKKFCLSSNTGSLPEVGEDYIDYANPYDLDEWIQKFSFLINTPDYIQQKEDYIQKNYKTTTWEECMKEILNSRDFS